MSGFPVQLLNYKYSDERGIYPTIKTSLRATKRFLRCHLENETNKNNQEHKTYRMLGIEFLALVLRYSVDVVRVGHRILA
jgi:hypothetical protein